MKCRRWGIVGCVLVSGWSGVFSTERKWFESHLDLVHHLRTLWQYGISRSFSVETRLHLRHYTACHGPEVSRGSHVWIVNKCWDQGLITRCNCNFTVSRDDTIIIGNAHHQIYPDPEACVIPKKKPCKRVGHEKYMCSFRWSVYQPTLAALSMPGPFTNCTFACLCLASCDDPWSILPWWFQRSSPPLCPMNIRNLRRPRHKQLPRNVWYTKRAHIYMRPLEW